ncbi:hypothetical protein [Nonomuraea sp. KM88]|uniref:hypothetical protein n=1 Tax=Nonomuraea sp. KM88 TaxID=3457427 RepID=UPI003FCE3D7A
MRGSGPGGLGAVLTTLGFGAPVLLLALGREAGWPWWTVRDDAGVGPAAGEADVPGRDSGLDTQE